MKILGFENISKGDVNVISVSVCFCVLFSAESTLTNIEKSLISSIEDDNIDFEVEGYVLLCIGFMTFGTFILLAPSVMNLLGVRTTMALGATIQTFGIFSYILEKEWVMYMTAATGGLAGSLLWAALTKYLIDNSKPETVNRNIGLFWASLSISGLFGNSYAFIELRGQKYIDRHTRHLIVYGLICTGAVASILFILLRPVAKDENQVVKHAADKSALDELKTVWKVFWTKQMLILCFTFGYVGLQQSFSYGTYSPTVGFTLQFGNKAKELIPISGMLTAIGGTIGGVWQMLHGTQINKHPWGRRIVVTISGGIDIVAYTLIFINLPADAIFGNTEEKAIIKSNIYIALLCSLLIGIADCCVNIQMYNVIALFPEEGAHSTAIYKFVKSMFVSTGYLTASRVNLHFLVSIYGLAAIIGVISFIFADIAVIKSQNKTRKDQGIKIIT